MHPLDGSRLKISRAQEHLDTLVSEIAAYVNTKPREIIRNQDDDSNEWNIHVSRQPPPRIATIVGDCLTNARAALDYIIWELSGLPSISPVRDFAKSQDKLLFSFPIFALPDDSKYVKKIKELEKRGIPAPVIDEIKSVQPYNAGYEILNILQTLVNIDKHRLPLLTRGVMNGSVAVDCVGSAKIDITGTRSTATSTSISGGRLTVGLPNDHAQRIAISAGEMKIHDDQPITVTWADHSLSNEPPTDALTKIVNCVAEIIPRFDTFFS